MSPKQIVALAVGIVALAVTAWKGPSAWAAVSTAITALCILALALFSKQPQISEYVTDLEDALEAQKPGQVAELRRMRRLPAKPPTPFVQGLDKSDRS